WRGRGSQGARRFSRACDDELNQAYSASFSRQFRFKRCGSHPLLDQHRNYHAGIRRSHPASCRAAIKFAYEFDLHQSRTAPYKPMNWFCSTSGALIMSITADTGTGLAPLRAKSGWIVALGVIYLIAGFIALGSVVFATVATVLVVGIMMIISGVAEVINAFQLKSWGKFLLWVLLGLLYIFAGFVTFENPLLAAALLTLMLGFALVASGIMRLVLAFGMKEGTPWLWVVLSGLITLALGVIILLHWPVSGLYI